MLPDPRANANLLLIEVGNSHVTLAGARDGRLGDGQRIEFNDWSSVGDRLDAAWGQLPEAKLRVAVLASVVPDRTREFRDLCTRLLDCQLVVLGEDMPVPIDTAVPSPRSVGIDRLLNAAAAWAEIQSACAVASFGTATTIDCVNGEGVYLGGSILPGLGTQAWSLSHRAAQLGEVSIVEPLTVYGGTTEEAIRNGIVYGAAGALREIVERYATDLGAWPRLVLTGGHAPMMKRVCDFVDAVVPDLVLRGMEHTYRSFYRTSEE